MNTNCIRHHDRRGKVRGTTGYPPTNVRLCDECWDELREKQGQTVVLEVEDGKAS